MEKLRDEIIEAQKIRADLLKWKMVVVAGLGVVGLGLKGDRREDTVLLLCLIPFVCVYVDIAARHVNLRMHVIAEFLRREGSLARQEEQWMALYEVFSSKMHNKKIFELETGVLRHSTIFLSILVGIAGYFMSTPDGQSVWFYLSALFGIGAAMYVDLVYAKKVKVIGEA